MSGIYWASADGKMYEMTPLGEVRELAPGEEPIIHPNVAVSERLDRLERVVIQLQAAVIRLNDIEIKRGAK